ncbi:MAG TPA: heme lyase CcmF/NrfE family subunit, partial [Nitrospirae bacterium]|nr:heme lyase CcmF/NrfE family subunit [Nitrospirota bacterium]
MTAIGGYALFFSFLLSIAVLASFVVGLKRKDGRFIDVGYRGTKVVFLSITAASLLLVYAFLTDDFRIQYVASYSERALPLFYKITGLWAGQKGSLLFWTWLLSLFTFITIVRDEKKPNTFYLPYVL